MKKNAFTLAEVLITLVIIGVVAALTIPTLIRANNKTETEAKIKQTYSILNNAIKMAEIENGPLSSWPWGDGSVAANKTALETYLYPYLKNMSPCGEGTGITCFYISPTDPGRSYKNLMGNPYDSNPTGPTQVAFSLANGVAVSIGGFGGSDAYWVQIFTDTNGAKSPNVYGKDLFQWYYFPGSPRITGRGHGSNSLADNSINCSTTTNITHNGTACAARIMQEGWQINYW